MPHVGSIPNSRREPRSRRQPDRLRHPSCAQLSPGHRRRQSLRCRYCVCAATAYLVGAQDRNAGRPLGAPLRPFLPAPVPPPLAVSRSGGRAEGGRDRRRHRDLDPARRPRADEAGLGPALLPHRLIADDLRTPARRPLPDHDVTATDVTTAADLYPSRRICRSRPAPPSIFSGRGCAISWTAEAPSRRRLRRGESRLQRRILADRARRSGPAAPRPFENFRGVDLLRDVLRAIDVPRLDVEQDRLLGPRGVAVRHSAFRSAPGRFRRRARGPRPSRGGDGRSPSGTGTPCRSPTGCRA